MNSSDDFFDISDFIIESIFKNSVVCDLGFGNTFLLNKILKQNANIKYIGVDKDVALCDKVKKIAQENGIKNVEVYVKDITHFDECKSNICVLSRIFHHFDNKESEKILKNAFKIISNKGRIIIIDSFRDYSNRKDRYNYFPIFFINQLSLFGIKNICFANFDMNSINIDELWKLIIDIDNKKASISFKKYCSQ